MLEYLSVEHEHRKKPREIGAVTLAFDPQFRLKKCFLVTFSAADSDGSKFSFSDATIPVS